jgi:hypothetical protein
MLCSYYIRYKYSQCSALTRQEKGHTHKAHQKKKKGYQFDTLYTVSVHS